MLPYSLQNRSKFTTTRLGLSQVITSDCKEGLAIGVEYWDEFRPTLVGYPRMGGLDMSASRHLSCDLLLSLQSREVYSQMF